MAEIAGRLSPKIDRTTLKASVSSTVKSRVTPEMVFGFIGPVGAGVSTTARLVKDCISDEYSYEVYFLKISELIKRNKDLIGFDRPVPDKGNSRIEALQDIGSGLRGKFGSDYLAAKAIEIIAVERAAGGYEDAALATPKERRAVTIIDSIKNEAEAQLLREVYGSAFWLIGVFANEDLRKRRLETDGVSASEIQRIIDRDSHEGPDHGQDVRDTFILSDYFINNNSDELGKLRASISRFLEVVFSTSIFTPTQDEKCMASAQHAAAGSSCLSRQVGAVVADIRGSIIGTGWNEVPKAGGGTYSNGCSGLDARCFKYGNEKCRNDQYKDEMFNEVSELATEFGLPLKGRSDFYVALRQTRIKALTEFSRSVHAEMAAIIDVVRSGGGTIQDSTLYVTTFPCHNCARHIIFSGISRIVYIEPYPKSLALHLHGDALSDLSKSNAAVTDSKVRLEPFEGVGPARYYAAFLRKDDVKEAGKFRSKAKATAAPADAANLDAFSTLEKRIAQHIKEVESEKA